MITIIDTNDHKPVFTKSTYNVNLEENVKRNFKVVQVLANDADTGPSGVVLYTITNQDKVNHFYIDSNSGRLYFY